MTEIIRKFSKCALFCVLLAVGGCFEESKTVEQPVAGTPPPPPPTANNNAPTISGNPPESIASGQSYSFTPNVSDADGDPLTHSIQNRPSWASFDQSNGTLSGRPAAADVGVYADIQISVSDGKSSAALPSFNISVVDAPSQNQAPTISGVPDTQVNAGEPYNFAPVSSDPDGDPLTFAISNKPSWASFDNSSGLLAGTPSPADVAVYDNIVISVSDGQATSALAAFSITVNQIATGSTTLTWVPPTTNDDGSSLVDLAGYRIYYGTSPGDYPNQIDIDSAGVASFVVEDLTPNTYFFVSTAVNQAGAESVHSNEATITIN